MSSEPQPTPWSALRIITARTGIYWVAGIVITLVYWSLGPVGNGWWIVPALLVVGLWMLRRGLNNRADHAAVARLVRGAAPVNGRWSAVGGTVVAQEAGDTEEIRAYRFQVFDRYGAKERRAESGSRRVLRIDGFHLIPTGIDTGTSVAPLHGFPDMTHNADKTPFDPDILQRARAAARQSPRWIPPPLARELVISGPMTSVQDCIAYPDKPENVPPIERDVTETWQLRRGDIVCGVGLWKDGALYPSYRRTGGLPVYHGTPEAVEERLRGDNTGFTIFSGIALALAAGVAIWSLL